jgi:hypothetical protein
MLAGRQISWKCVKQSITISFTMQTEFVIYYEATDQTIWLKNFIPELQVIGNITRLLTLIC